MREQQAARGGSPLVKSMSHPGAFIFSGVAQLVEQLLCKQTVGSSSLSSGAKHSTIEFLVAGEWNVHTIRGS